MEVDACTYERTNACQFHEDGSKVLPYSLCGRDGCRREVEVAEGAVRYVPSKALLALFKVKARRDRSYDINNKGATLNPARLAWLKGKAVKDGSDIIALLDPKDRGAKAKDGMDYVQLGSIALEFDISKFAMDTFKEVLNDRSALSLYGRDVDTSPLLKRVARIKS